MAREHIDERELEDIDRRLAGNGSIIHRDTKVVWWIMGFIAILVSNLITAAINNRSADFEAMKVDVASLHAQMAVITAQNSAMAAQLQLLLDGRIKDADAKP